MSQQRKFFPGWLVVASGFVIMATCYTIFVNCMSLFQPLIVSDLGISLAQYTISNAHDRRVQAVWHGRPRQGHGHHYLARDGRRHRRRYRLGVLFDATGSFASTWIVCLVCSVVMLVFLLASEPIAAKLRASVAGE